MTPKTPKTSKPKKPSRQQARYDPQRGSAPPEMIDLVDPKWILKALGAVFGVALLFAYVTICILFSRSQWQLVLHPVRTSTTTPASLGLNFTPVHFGVDATGQPQIDGWWIPAESTADTASPAAAAGPTVLFLHSGDGSMANALSEAQTLHSARLNVLLFDYRGYGQSAGLHPTQSGMQTDSETALSYLTTTRRIPISSVVIYGTGVGASLAVHLCSSYPSLPALILQAPLGDLAAIVRHDPRSKAVPFTLLFDQNFPLSGPLQTLSTPKLLISTATSAIPPAFENAANPKTTVELPAADSTSLTQSVDRFLDTYLHR
jgi:pimeloyl-ACP methyl ester carboxylesterase